MTRTKSCAACDDASCEAQRKRSDEEDQDFRARQRLSARMCQIAHKVLVLSGKGGVGKSTVAVNLAAALALEGQRVGLLDVDIHGPSIPKLLRIEGTEVSGEDGAIDPVRVGCRPGVISAMSVGLLLPKRDDPVIWRGPRKYHLIKQFLTDVQWGQQDYLVVDSPPGTGDEPLAVCQLLEHPDGAVIVTTPQELSVQDVRRCINFCRQVELPVLGVIENMSGFVCPGCGERVEIFGSGGGQRMADEMNVPFLGTVPIEPEVVTSGDRGRPLVQSCADCAASRVFRRIARMLLDRPAV